jgi:polyisoprenyl-teichoic acid--peptidoglycan teichoic acid transferase
MSGYFDRLEAQLADLHEQGRHLPRFGRRSSRVANGIAATLSVAVAVAIAVFAIVVVRHAPSQSAMPLNDLSAIRASVQSVKAGAPQTLLVILSDHRAGTPYKPSNTDAIMLVRLDDNSSTINVLSIPADLRVQLPDGPGKLNAAYAQGGPNLLIRTLKTQVFPALVVNHILDVDSGGFEDLVNTIGCVYSDVDHRYFNSTAQTEDSSIDLQPGYQKLCGSQALDFVRYRHADPDSVRDARTEGFLSWAKNQLSPAQLLSGERMLLRVFGAHVQTDHALHTTSGLLDLFDLAVNNSRDPIHGIPFPAIFGPPSCTSQGGCVLTASHRAEAAAYQALITPTSSASIPRRTAASITNAGLIADPAGGQAQASALGHAGMPAYYPNLIPAGSTYCSTNSRDCEASQQPASEYAAAYPRAYEIQADGHDYPAYRITIAVNPALDEYAGVQGTTWQHPPILNNPTRSQTVSGKQLLEYYDRGHLVLVAFKTRTAVYWISNTLTDSVGNHQLIAMAASMRPAG